MTQQHLKKIANLAGNLATNINYINNINDNNNITTNDSEASHYLNEVLVPSGNNNEKSSAKEISRKLPAGWQSIKWDLWRNPEGMKLRATVKLEQGTQFQITAALNSPHDRLFRGITDRQSEHWSRVYSHYRTLRDNLGTDMQLWRCSKFYEGAKQGCVDLMAVFLIAFDEPEGTDYEIQFWVNGLCYRYELGLEQRVILSKRQQAQNQYATLTVHRAQEARLIDPRARGWIL
jgi:hypothetical protein